MDRETSPERKPTPPFPVQHQEPPGEEAQLDPRPRYQAPEYRAAGKLQGKTALVTGGDSGIGRAVCVLFAREGADVAFTFLPQERRDADETVQAIRAEGVRALAMHCDVTNYEDCEQAVEQTVRELGKLDVLVNNAAYQQHIGEVDDLDLAHWEHTFDVNIHGYFRMVK